MATELDIRDSRLIDECQFPKPDDIAELLKWEIFFNAMNYYEVKTWTTNSLKQGMELLHTPKL